MKKSLIFVAGLLGILFISCGKSGKSNVVVSDLTSTNSAVNFKQMKVAAESVAYEDADFDITDNAVEAPSAEFERKLIKNGYVTISVPDFGSIDNMIQNYAKMYGGYITNTFLSEYNYNAEIKVPSSAFDNAMNNMGTLGEVKNRSQNSSDVTDEYYDLESRINTKKILKEKLEGYLKKAASIKELMDIERQLNNVVSELESMEGRMKRLSNQIDYSTININAVLPTGYSDSGFDWPDLKDKFSKLGYNIVNFLAGFLVFILYLVLYGLPILALVAFLFWLLFGKVGLLRKLYNKLKK